MDPLTHTLSGIVLANLVGPDAGRAAYTATLVVAANLPDIDFLTRPLKTLGSPKYYHNFTHSVVGVLLLSSGAALLTHIVHPFLGTVQLMGLYLLGCGFHTLLDTVIASCFVRLLWPFSNRQVSMALLAGLNFRTASRDCGRPRYLRCVLCQLRGGLFNPTLFLFSSGDLLGLLWPEERRMVSSLTLFAAGAGFAGLYGWKLWVGREVSKGHPEVRSSSLHIYPADVIPSRWLAIEETPTEYRMFSIRGIPPRIRSLRRLPRPETCSHPAVVRSRSNGLYALYRSRMAHPYVEYREHNGNIRVTWKDARYLQSPSVDLYAVKIDYTKDLEQVSQEFRECWK